MLLLALLARHSTSELLLAHCREATILLSEHVLDTARHVLQSKAPHLLGAYSDSILQLIIHHRTEVVSSTAPYSLPSVASELGEEDCQVYADALSGRADILFSLDSDFLESELRGTGEIEIRDVGNLLWPIQFHGGRVVEFNQESWTFLGWYVPNYWTSEIFEVGKPDSVFFIFEVREHIACYYEAHRDRYVLRWDTKAGECGRLHMEHQTVASGSMNFVFVVVAPDHVMLFVNGETRERDVRLGPVPRTGSMHPFQDASGGHQIFGDVQFRVVPKAVPERRLRRHWRSRSIWLTDDEVELQRILGPVLEYGLGGNP